MENILRFKGLTFATLGLVLAFLMYLALNVVLNAKSESDLKYTTSLVQLLDQVSPTLDSNESQKLLASLQAYSSGQSLRISGETINTQSLADFLAPQTSSLDSLVAQMSSGDLVASTNTAKGLLKSVQKRIAKKLKLTKYLQFAAALIAIALYLLVIIPMISRLSESQDTEVKVVDETKGIMSTVSEGLFLLDHDYQIGVEQSASLRKIFKLDRDLEGDFFDFISNYVSQHTVQTAQEFLGLLYGDRVKEKLIKDLNPLNEVEINLVRRDGSYESRYLDFQFNRVMEDDKLKQILVSVTDETRRVLLERELAETKEEQEAQMDLLLRILKVDQAQLRAFFSAANTDLNAINSKLEARGHSSLEIQSKVTEISKTVHKLKGDAAALGLHNFEFIAHALEEELVMVKNTSDKVSGKALLPAITKIKDLFSELEQMESLVEKLSQGQTQSLIEDGGSIEQNPVLTDDTSASGFANILHDLSRTVSKRNNKRAHIEVHGLDLTELPDELQEPMQSVAVQLVRNSIVHGSLMPEERLEAGKTDYINITTSLNETDQAYTLYVRDDGEGLDNQAILDRAIEIGMIKPEQLDRIDVKTAFKLIFHPSFSQLSEATLDGGRGVGLSLVHSMVKELGGAISVQHKLGRFSQFKVSIPKA